MLKRYSFLLLVVTLAFACSKDKLETKPSITLKSVNSTEIYSGMDLVILLEYRDKEGDLGNGLLTYLPERLNIFYPIINPQPDSVGYTLPDFPKTSEGEIQVVIPGNFLNENPNYNDTVRFHIVVTDLAGNVSDTLTTPVIVQIDED